MSFQTHLKFQKNYGQKVEILRIIKSLMVLNKKNTLFQTNKLKKTVFQTNKYKNTVFQTNK